VKHLLLDQGLPRSAAALLTQAGWDVIHVSEIGMSRADDVDILQRARTEARICITLDADFHSLLAISGERMSFMAQIFDGPNGPSVSRCHFMLKRDLVGDDGMPPPAGVKN
jgi:hypothetical protein